MSYALLIKINSRKVILGGDGTTRVWTDIADNCAPIIENIDVLKAAHHGHLSGFYEKAAELMKPKFIIFSNSLGEHRVNGVEREYKSAIPGAEVCKTFEGTIVVDVPFEQNEEILIYQ